MRTLMYHVPHNMTHQPASKRHMGTPSSKHPSTLTKGTCVHGLPIQWWLEIHDAPGSYSTGVHYWLVPSKKQSYFFCHSVNTWVQSDSNPSLPGYMSNVLTTWTRWSTHVCTPPSYLQDELTSICLLFFIHTLKKQTCPMIHKYPLQGCLAVRMYLP